jgi:hypothetical protein
MLASVHSEGYSYQASNAEDQADLNEDVTPIGHLRLRARPRWIQSHCHGMLHEPTTCLHNAPASTLVVNHSLSPKPAINHSPLLPQRLNHRPCAAQHRVKSIQILSPHLALPIPKTILQHSDLRDGKYSPNCCKQRQSLCCLSTCRRRQQRPTQ